MKLNAENLISVIALILMIAGNVFWTGNNIGRIDTEVMNLTAAVQRVETDYQTSIQKIESDYQTDLEVLRIEVARHAETREVVAELRAIVDDLIREVNRLRDADDDG